MNKIIFGSGAFSTPLRIVVTDEQIEKATLILSRLERLAEEFNCEFEASIDVMKVNPEDDHYGAQHVWIEVTAGPSVKTEHYHLIIMELLTGQAPNAIVLMRGGPEGGEPVDYKDIREMPDLFVSETMAYHIWDAQTRPNQWNEGWIEEVLKPLAQTDEEFEALTQSGIDYGEMIKEEE